MREGGHRSSINRESINGANIILPGMDQSKKAHTRKVNKRQRHQEGIVEYKIQMLKKLMQEGVSVGTMHSLFHKNKEVIESAMA